MGSKPAQPHGVHKYPLGEAINCCLFRSDLQVLTHVYSINFHMSNKGNHQEISCCRERNPKTLCALIPRYNWPEHRASNQPVQPVKSQSRILPMGGLRRSMVESASTRATVPHRAIRAPHPIHRAGKRLTVEDAQLLLLIHVPSPVRLAAHHWIVELLGRVEGMPSRRCSMFP